MPIPPSGDHRAKIDGSAFERLVLDLLSESGAGLPEFRIEHQELVTASDAPRIDIAWVETNVENGGPKGSKGVGEPPCVPTSGAVANALTKLIGAQVRQLPMTPERVWAASKGIEA